MRLTVDRHNYVADVGEQVYPKTTEAALEELRARGVACDLAPGGMYSARELDAIVDSAEAVRGVMTTASGQSAKIIGEDDGDNVVIFELANR